MKQSEPFSVSHVHTTSTSPQAWKFCSAVFENLRLVRCVDIKIDNGEAVAGRQAINLRSNILDIVAQISNILIGFNKIFEAEALQNALAKCNDAPEFGGLGLAGKTDFTESERSEILFQVQAWLEAVNSAERAKQTSVPIARRAEQTKPMTLAQKIFAHHAIGGCPVEGLTKGTLTRVSVDWVMASELSYKGIQKTIDEIGESRIFRNDRFWLAGDHVYDPRIATVPRVHALFEAAEKAKKDFKMTEYQGMNYTIMHTEFVRERAEPGMLVIGADSHTCSAGAVGCLAIGLGAVDVAMALVTGETWFKMPESILINFVGETRFGISGKDVILHILKKLKRNTVAADRIVEFSGPGLKCLSVDARFAISNMCTEFGAITGVFAPDEITQEYITHRRRKANKSHSVYFQPDRDADYAGIFDMDLSEVEPTLARYPNPDDVVPISEQAGMHFDGVFIGACTTTEEELVLAALVLKVGLSKNLPLARGTRHVVPGSLPIVEKLRKLQLLEVYEAAGFTRGPPGCSFCVGMAADQAGEGETWLSSQNRNFKNRMGKGSFGNITSAAVVAASSFSMTLTDCMPFLEEVDTTFFNAYKNIGNLKAFMPVTYVEPRVGYMAPPATPQPKATKNMERSDLEQEAESRLPLTINSKVIVLEDFIDTDALAPAQVLATASDDKEFGDHCLEHTHPEFRQKVRDGQKVLVAGKAFGCGSSREEAVRALKGLGVQAVIAKSFAFIYGRNQPSLGLLGITMEDDDFFDTATEAEEIEINIPRRRINVGKGDEAKQFEFKMAEMEYRLTANQGIAEAYKRYKDQIWREMTKKSPDQSKTDVVAMVEDAIGDESKADARLEW